MMRQCARADLAQRQHRGLAVVPVVHAIPFHKPCLCRERARWKRVVKLRRVIEGGWDLLSEPIERHRRVAGTKTGELEADGFDRDAELVAIRGVDVDEARATRLRRERALCRPSCGLSPRIWDLGFVFRFPES